MANEQKRLVRIGFPFAPHSREFPSRGAMGKDSTEMMMSAAELEFLKRLSHKLKHSGSPIWIELQAMEEA